MSHKKAWNEGHEIKIRLYKEIGDQANVAECLKAWFKRGLLPLEYFYSVCRFEALWQAIPKTGTICFRYQSTGWVKGLGSGPGNLVWVLARPCCRHPGAVSGCPSAMGSFPVSLGCPPRKTSKQWLTVVVYWSGHLTAGSHEEGVDGSLETLSYRRYCNVCASACVS